MDTRSLKSVLPGCDLRAMRQSGINVSSIDDQPKFDYLFNFIFHNERAQVIRAAKAIEKITATRPEFLRPHKTQLLEVLNTAHHKELKFHTTRIIARINLTQAELNDVWHKLAYWAMNKAETKIARVNALQGLFELSTANPQFNEDFENVIFCVGQEMIPSIRAKIRKLKKH